MRWPAPSKPRSARRAASSPIRPTSTARRAAGGSSSRSRSSGEGTLLTWTRAYALPLDYAELFITLGIVEMDMGVRATGRLDIAEPQNGTRVRASLGTVREIGGKEVTGLVFTAV